jgi:hypothetical protein
MALTTPFRIGSFAFQSAKSEIITRVASVATLPSPLVYVKATGVGRKTLIRSLSGNSYKANEAYD